MGRRSHARLGAVRPDAHAVPGDRAKNTSALSILHLWGEALQGDAGVLRRTRPVHTLVGRMAPRFPLCGFLEERLESGDPPLQAWQGQGTACARGAREPTALLRGIGDLQTRGQPAGLLWRACLREGTYPVRAEVITDQTYTVHLWRLEVQALWHLSSPVHGRRVRSDTAHAHPLQRLGAHAEVGGAVPRALRVVALGGPLSRRQRLSDLLPHLHGLCRHAYPRDLRISGRRRDLPAILPRRPTRPTRLGRHAPSGAEAVSTPWCARLADGLGAARLPPLHGDGLVGHESERPAGRACGGRPAPAGAQSGLARAIPHGTPGGRGLWLPVACGLTSRFDHTVADAKDGLDTDGTARRPRGH